MCAGVAPTEKCKQDATEDDMPNWAHPEAANPSLREPGSQTGRPWSEAGPPVCGSGTLQGTISLCLCRAAERGLSLCG